MGIGKLRKAYHQDLCQSILGYRNGVVSNADSGSATSRSLAKTLLDRIGITAIDSVPAGQAIGAQFELLTQRFLQNSFALLSHIRPGTWEFSASRKRPGIAKFDQYEHLTLLEELLASVSERSVAAALQGDYLIMPDITIGRHPLADDEVNARGFVVSRDGHFANRTPLRMTNDSIPNLHASVSCKWTIRSDRAQNVRTEALNLVRNRKGRLPHVVAVTGEPMPTRLASLALGTGDLDCVYHIALDELAWAVSHDDNQDQLEMLETLVEGKRLRDISDLPFDLAI